jgi:hypothetical protein
MTSEEVQWLITVIECDDESDDVRVAAADTLAKYTFPGLL